MFEIVGHIKKKKRRKGIFFKIETNSHYILLHKVDFIIIIIII